MSGSLPAIPDGCDPANVVIRAFTMSSPDMSVELRGTLPPSWAELKRLESLDLSFTGVAGTLPPQWGALSSLQYLNLGYNNLSGTLPSDWGFLTSLRELYLNDNRLSGEIPESWLLTKTLEVLDLTNNELGGQLPGFSLSSQRTLGPAMLSRNSGLEYGKESLRAISRKI
ncbi:hypothetical protein JKF63_01053 [Porcisia hertigi]|uniref:Uncharacterized protein n=1 Tax=Porcisia hertigi TaxID=2761500 RepID=A0A836IC75_9TRYP|nr:hypothetical protein JKF63_01053 [Porcisia hertigi]